MSLLKKIFKNYSYSLVLIFFVIVAYHFLWLNGYSMKWDMSEQYLPWRFFLSKALNNGNIPIWNPFQLGGYPTFADPQSGFWFYPTWVISLISGYSMRVIEFEIVLALCFAAIGFFKLASKFNIEKIPALCIAICYVASGFFVGNAQHITWIYAGVFLPWILYYYIDLRLKLNRLVFAKFILVFYLFISSSYPAFLIVLIYILSIDQIQLFIFNKQKIDFIKSRLILLAGILLISSPIIYSVVSSADYFSRGGGISLEKALQHPFSFNSLISLIFPFSTFKNSDFFQTDLSMANAYIGIFSIPILFLGLFRKLTKVDVVLIATSILFLLISFGAETSIRAWLYEYLPGFNLFRFPSLFRLFFLSAFLLLIGRNLNYLNINNLRYALIGFVIVAIGILLYYKNQFEFIEVLNYKELHKILEAYSFNQHILFQLSIHVVLIISFLLAHKFIASKKIMLLAFIAIDMFVSIQLNAFASMVVNVKTENVDQLIRNKDLELNKPELIQLKECIDQRYEYRWPLNWNMNCYYGQIAVDGYNPFVLKSFNTLSDNPLRDSIWSNYWYYATDSINQIKGNVEAIELIEFNTSAFVFKTNFEREKYFNIAQNPYPGWIVRINGEKNIPIVKNISHLSIKVPAGENRITWEYNNPIVYTLLYSHLLVFITLLVYILCIEFINLRKI